jgi:hypothetical protein
MQQAGVEHSSPACDSNHVSRPTERQLADQLHHVVTTAAAHTIGQRTIIWASPKRWMDAPTLQCMRDCWTLHLW